jgi:triacylglycerol lipase
MLLFGKQLSLRVLVREANALRKQSLLLHRDWGSKGVAVHPRTSNTDVVFLLHGVFASAGVFRPLEERLRAAGIQHVGKFSYRPGRSVVSLAQQLRKEIEYIPQGTRIHLVGHSLGGVVGRYYVQELGGSARIRQTISLASPFHGTSVARWLPLQVARELSPSSELLAALRDPMRLPRNVPHTSIVADSDMVVVPPSSAAFPFGDVVVVEGLGHNGLLFDEEVANMVVQRILDVSIEDERAA